MGHQRLKTKVQRGRLEYCIVNDFSWMERSIPVEFALLLGGSFKKKNGGVAPAII